MSAPGRGGKVGVVNGWSRSLHGEHHGERDDIGLGVLDIAPATSCVPSSCEGQAELHRGPQGLWLDSWRRALGRERGEHTLVGTFR